MAFSFGNWIYDLWAWLRILRTTSPFRIFSFIQSLFIFIYQLINTIAIYTPLDSNIALVTLCFFWNQYLFNKAAFFIRHFFYSWSLFHFQAYFFYFFTYFMVCIYSVKFDIGKQTSNLPEKRMVEYWRKWKSWLVTCFYCLLCCLLCFCHSNNQYCLFQTLKSIDSPHLQLYYSIVIGLCNELLWFKTESDFKKNFLC